MAVQPIKLNLVPEPSFLRERHLPLGWSALALGAAVLLSVSAYTTWSYLRASRAGRAAVSADAQTRVAAGQERQILSELQRIDVDQELPRWRLAERILSERAAPWSRVAAELEQCLVDGTRIKDAERARGAGQSVLIKLKAESRSREAESGFIENLRKDPVFTQVDLEREAQQPGGGWEYDLSLPVAPLPPPFVALDAKGRPVQPAPAPVAASTPASVPAAPAQPAKPAIQTGSERVAPPATGVRGTPAMRPAPGAPRIPPPIQRRPERGGRA